MASSGDDCEWDARLQGWIDGDLDADESEAVLAHAARCARCHERFEVLRALDDQLAGCLPRLALDEDFNRRVFASIGRISSDLASARARLERDWSDQQSALRRLRRRVRNRIMLNVLAILLIATATTFWPLPDISAWLDRLLALTPDPAWSASLSLAAISTVVAFSVMAWLTAAERD